MPVSVQFQPWLPAYPGLAVMHCHEHSAQGILSEEPLYDPRILERLDFSKARTRFSPPVSAARPGEGLRVRPLRRADYRRGKSTVVPRGILGVGRSEDLGAAR